MNKQKLPIKLLYISDNEDITEIVTKILGRFIGTVLCADNLESGYEIFKLSKPQIVITNIKTTLSENIKIAKQIKALEPLSIIIGVHEESRANPYEETQYIDAVTTEPLDIDKLQEKIKLLLD